MSIEVFFSYSHKDEKLRDGLATHLTMLERDGVIKAWYDRDIGAGTEWDGAINAHLDSAQVILLLISPDFLASKYCWDTEVKRAIERHEAGEARVIPVILRPVDSWQKAPFGRLQALPKNAKPVTTWRNRDEAFKDVAQGIRKAIAELAATPPKPTSPEITSNPPQTTDALVEQIEQYLSDPNAYISLNKLLEQEAKALAEVMQGELEACPWVLSTHNQSQCQQCVEYLEAKSERFVRILATIVYHDQDARFVSTITKAFRILAKQPLPINTNFIDESRYVRLYPLALAMYAVFIVGVQEGRERVLRTILDIRWSRKADSLPNLPLVCALIYLYDHSHSIFNAVLGGTPYYTPVPVRIQRILIPWIKELLFDADAALYQGEFVLGLADIEAKRPAYLSDGKRLSLEGTYLYQYKARRIISAFLHDSSHWLIDLYPSLEELLKTFDETASGWR